MPDDQSVFRASFHALTDHRPFPWQERLFEAFTRGDIPRSVALPTASGKTSVMPIWVMALGWQARQAPAHVFLPRRLIWVVNRRVVVDQATEEAARLVERITHPERAAEEDQSLLQSLRGALAGLSILGELGEPPLAVSTLRGELADNEEWKLDPSRPAIVIGTVDMIGSRLLFSGYGDGLWKRPHHAGLLGQDALIVHDEAHLTPAFGALLEGVEAMQTRYGSGPKPFVAMQLSATLQTLDAGTFGLAEDDLQDKALNPRLRAEKWLRLHPLDRGVVLEDRLVALALSHQSQGVRVLVYVQSPQTAVRVAAKLRNAAPDHVAVLTGTLRGYERDRLPEDPVFQRFLPGLAQTGTHETAYLVSTSAGEVGINLDADHMVGEFPSADHLIQQLGRVQRFGRGRGLIDLVDRASD